MTESRASSLAAATSSALDSRLAEQLAMILRAEDACGVTVVGQTVEFLGPDWEPDFRMRPRPLSLVAKGDIQIKQTGPTLAVTLHLHFRWWRPLVAVALYGALIALSSLERGAAHSSMTALLVLYPIAITAFIAKKTLGARRWLNALIARERERLAEGTTAGGPSN